MGLACIHDGPLDIVLMRLCDVFKALPSTLLALFLSVAMGGGAAGIVIALSIVDIPQTARLVRARARVVDASLFVMAKRSAGIGEARILACTVLPHVLPSLLVQCAFVFSSSILAEAALSFIGAGLPMGQASWGTILAEARGVIHQAWWMVVFPTLFVFLSTLSVNLVADGLCPSILLQTASRRTRLLLMIAKGSFSAAFHDEAVSLLERVCTIPAPSHDEGRRADFIMSWLEEKGVEGEERRHPVLRRRGMRT